MMRMMIIPHGSKGDMYLDVLVVLHLNLDDENYDHVMRYSIYYIISDAEEGENEEKGLKETTTSDMIMRLMLMMMITAKTTWYYQPEVYFMSRGERDNIKHEKNKKSRDHT